MNPIPQPHPPPSAQNSAWPIPGVSPLLSSASTFTSTNPQWADPAQDKHFPLSISPAPSVCAPGMGWTPQFLPLWLGRAASASLPFIGTDTPKLLSGAILPPTHSLCLPLPLRPGPQTTWLAFLWPGQRLKLLAVNARIVLPWISPSPCPALPPLQEPKDCVTSGIPIPLPIPPSPRGTTGQQRMLSPPSAQPQTHPQCTPSSLLLPAINSNGFLPPTQRGHFILHRGVESGLTSLEFIRQVKRERKGKVCGGPRNTTTPPLPFQAAPSPSQGGLNALNGFCALS